MTFATAKTRQSRPSVIDERRHGNLPYRIITANEDIINLSGEQLVRACRMEISSEVWQDNFWKMISHIRDWARDHHDSLDRILIDFCNDKVVFFLVPKSERFDFDLGFAQAELDVYLNTRGNIGYAETRQIPSWDIETFVSRNARIVWPEEMDGE
jgi:hypothetical protein